MTTKIEPPYNPKSEDGEPDDSPVILRVGYILNKEQCIEIKTAERKDEPFYCRIDQSMQCKKANTQWKFFIFIALSSIVGALIYYINPILDMLGITK